MDGNAFIPAKLFVCQNMHIHTRMSYVLGKQWKAVFFFTREFLPKSEIKIKILKKKCFFGGFHLPEVRKKGVEITIFIYLVFSVWPKI
jgi:hypothetical protein